MLRAGSATADQVWIASRLSQTKFAMVAVTGGLALWACWPTIKGDGQAAPQISMTERPRSGYSAKDQNERRGMRFTVAIDGPAAAGKGTIARAIAARFGFAHLDTGLLYRAVAVKGGDPVAAAQGLTAQDLARDDLRSMDAGQAASRVAVIPQVRAALVEFQRRFARAEGGAVLDGRDIGTVICPGAEVKIFVTASAEVRAHRRWLELGGDAGEVLAAVRERDARDIGRADAPLKAAADATVIDTSALSIEDAVERACAVINGRLAE